MAGPCETVSKADPFTGYLHSFGITEFIQNLLQYTPSIWVPANQSRWGDIMSAWLRAGCTSNHPA
jgi:hypothetical protein